jgi:hypothetical protein
MASLSLKDDDHERVLGRQSDTLNDMPSTDGAGLDEEEELVGVGVAGVDAVDLDVDVPGAAEGADEPHAVILNSSDSLNVPRLSVYTTAHQ